MAKQQRTNLFSLANETGIQLNEEDVLKGRFDLTPYTIMDLRPVSLDIRTAAEIYRETENPTSQRPRQNSNSTRRTYEG